MLNELKTSYPNVKGAKDFKTLMGFAKRLAELDSEEAIRYHFDLLRDRENDDLYLYLRDAFSQRRSAKAESFLVQAARTDVDPRMRSDALLILGLMESEAALSLARDMVRAPEDEIRDNCASVLGWLGEERDIEALHLLLMNDASKLVRRSAASALDQLCDRIPSSRRLVQGTLLSALQREASVDVQRAALFALQEISGKKFGIQLDDETGDLTGDAPRAIQKALAMLQPRR